MDMEKPMIIKKKKYSCQRTELGNLTSAGQAWSPTMAAGSTRQVETPSNSAEARGVLQSCKSMSNMSDMSKLSSVTSRWIRFEYIYIYIQILNYEVSEIPIHMHLTTHQEEGFVWRRSLGSLAWPGMGCQPCKGALLLLGIGHPPPRLGCFQVGGWVFGWTKIGQNPRMIQDHCQKTMMMPMLVLVKQ